MNITNAEHEVIQGDMLEAIFNRQKELMEKYHDIEANSGLMQTEDCPVNLDTKQGQVRIKDFAWRVTEELGEALDANYNDQMDHYKEELVDGLHFLVELSILADFKPTYKEGDKDQLQAMFDYALDPTNRLYEEVTFFIRNLGMTCNCLKNKPWKQSQMLTDKAMFYKNLDLAWLDYMRILSMVFDSAEEIAQTYLAKSQVNKFRQRSNY